MEIRQRAFPRYDRKSIGFALLLLLLLLVAAGKAVLADTIDPDCFWHLRVAEQLHRDGIRPLVDQISFASIKTPWTPYSWLGELSMKWLWDHAGMLGVVMTQAILEAGFLTLIAMSCLQRNDESPHESPPLMSVIVATAFGAFLTLPYLSFRPVLVAVVLLAICALLLLRDRAYGERTRAIWAIPLLAAIGINFHFYALFIPAWIGALMVGAGIERKRSMDNLVELDRRLSRYAILLGTSIAACCCTPMLPGLISSVVHYSTNDPLVHSGVIAEMQPMYLGLDKQICLAIVGVVICVAAMRRSLRIGEWLWLLGMLVIFVRLGRAGTIFVPIFAPVMAWSLPRMSDGILARRPTWITATIVLIIGGGRIIWSLPSANQDADAWLNRHGPTMPGFPAGAANFVQQHVARSTGHLINEFDWGGYLAWKLPDYQVLLDGRTQLYSPQFWQEAYLSDPPVTSRFLADQQADAAVLPAHGSRYRDALIGLGWKPAFKDERAEVLIPPTSVARLLD